MGLLMTVLIKKLFEGLAKLANIGDLKQTDAAAGNLQIFIQKDSRPSEFTSPLTSITLNLNGNLSVDRRCVSLLKFPIAGETPLFPT